MLDSAIVLDLPEKGFIDRGDSVFSNSLKLESFFILSLGAKTKKFHLTGSVAGDLSLLIETTLVNCLDIYSREGTAVLIAGSSFAGTILNCSG